MVAISISTNNKYFAWCDNSDDHNVFVFIVNNGKKIYSEKGGKSKILGIQWSKNISEIWFLTVGIKHAKFWTPLDPKSKSKICSGTNQTIFSCVTSD